MPDSPIQSVGAAVSRREFLTVLTTGAAAMAVVPVPSATALAHSEAKGAALRGPDGRIISFHPPMASGIPLGGMGAGTFEIRADGAMYDWQIFNNWAQKLILPDTFFAIHAQQNGPAGPATVTRRLETLRHNGKPGAPVGNITYVGRFPIAQLNYDEPALPVNVKLTAWSPFIPHQPKDSGLPAAIFRFAVSNPSADRVKTTLLFSMRNGVGLNNGWTGTQNQVERHPDMTAIYMNARTDSRPSAFDKPVRVLVLLESMPARVREVFADTRNLHLDTSVNLGDTPLRLPVATAAELAARYDAIWLGEIPHASATLGQHNMELIRDAVHSGVGLLVTGGWDAFYGDSPDRWGHLNGTPVEQALPITFCDTFDAIGAQAQIKVNLKTDFVLGSPESQTLGGYNRIASVRPGAKVILESDNGSPLLITGQYGKGRTAVWATAVDGGWPPQNWAQASAFYGGLLGHLAHATYTSGYGVDSFESSWGNMTLALLDTQGASAAQWHDSAAFWGSFERDGSLVNQDVAAGDPRNAAMACTFELSPGQTRDATFLVTWHFPNQYDYSNNRNFLGHMYNRWFNDSREVAHYVAQRHAGLWSQTESFQNALYAGSLPAKVSDAINAQLTTLNKETWWVKDGTYAVWEGMGCCGLQTMDVAFYASHPITLLFPHQQKTSMRLTARHQKADGELPHFFPGTFEHPDAWYKIDLMPAFALMVYRDYLWSGDIGYLREMWPVVTKGIGYDQRTDKNGNFLPDDNGPDSTFDGWPMNGTTSYVSSIFLAALAAGIRMAEILGDSAIKANYTDWLERGKRSFETELWNGRYYQMARDTAAGTQNTGILLAGTVGQWFADLCDLGDILPRDHVWSHNEAAFHYCRQKTRQGMPYVNADDGIAYINGFWPHGGTPAGEGQWSGPWTGIEYMFASALAWLNRADLAVQVTTDVYNRYVNRRAPWDHIECGDHYFRPLSVWTVLLGLQGFRWDAPRRSLGFAPRISPENHRSVFCTTAGWGEYFATTTGAVRQHRVLHRAGKLTLCEFTIGRSAHEGKTPPQAVQATCAGKPIVVHTAHTANRLVFSFPQPLRLAANSVLEIGWHSQD